MDNITDSELTDLIESGNQDAFMQLLIKYQSAIHGYAYHLSQNDFAAEDITQETFIAAYSNLHTLKNARSLESWLRSITYHKSMDWIHQNRLYGSLPENLPQNHQGAIDLLERKETVELLSNCVKTLSEPNRIVVTLKLEGLKNSEIADFLELPQNVVDNRLLRARKQLQKDVMKSLESGYPKLGKDFAEATYRKIKYHRPLIAVELCFQDNHAVNGCICISSTKFLSEKTGGVFREFPGKGAAIYYGMDKIREDDADRAIKVALDLHHKSCPAGSFSLGIRQVTDSVAGKADGLWGISNNGNIVVDSTIAWMLRREFGFDEIQQTGLNKPVYKLITDSWSEAAEKDIIVGRYAELSQVEDLVQNLLLGGSGIVQLTGAAGIGKTHLLRTIRRKFQDEELIWLEGKADHFQPLHPIQEALQSHFRFHSAHELRKHLEDLDMEDSLPYLAHLLSLPFESSEKRYNSLTVERLQYHSFKHFHDWMKCLSEEIPIVFVIEDTQWMDEESSKALRYIARLARSHPVLFIFSRRSGYEQVPEMSYGAELQEFFVQSYSRLYHGIHLKPLSDEDSLALISRFLNPKKLLPTKLERVLKSASGNPLYIREVSQFMASSEDADIPPGIERLILAHLDSMPSTHQAILQYMSVIGNYIYISIIDPAFADPDLMSRVNELEQMGWICPEPYTDLECASLLAHEDPQVFVWQHDLYREAIYKGIETTARKRIHVAVARQLEEIGAIGPDLLAEHYDAGGVAEKAVHYAYRAVKLYIDQERYRLVPGYADMALAHPEVMSKEQKHDLYYSYALALLRSGQAKRAIKYWEQAIGYADTKEQRIDIYLEWAKCVPRADSIRMREHVIELLDESMEISLIIDICRKIAACRGMPGLSHLNRFLLLAQVKSSKELESWFFCILAESLIKTEDFDGARSNIQNAIQIAETLHDNQILGEMEAAAGYIYMHSSQWQEAIDHLQRAFRILEKTETDTYGVWATLGAVYRKSGQYELMVSTIEQMLQRRELIMDVWDFSMSALTGLVQGYAYLGDWEKAYGYFWQMMDNLEPFLKDSFVAGEEAVAALCHGDKINQRWTYEDIPVTMKRASKLVRALYQHDFTPEDMKRLKLLNPILASAYVEYGAKRSHEDAVEMLLLFVSKTWAIDEIIEFWAYLCRSMNRDELETALNVALKRADETGEEEIPKKPDFLDQANPERSALKWMKAILNECYEEENKGKHLMELGFISEPYWQVIGLYEGNVSNEIEQDILEAVFSLSRSAMPPEVNDPAYASDIQEDERLSNSWFKPNDYVDAYIDFRYIFQTMDSKSGYAVADIQSPGEQRVKFSVFVDDKICIWINGEKQYEQSNSGFGDFQATIKPGHNRILVRLTNYSEGWGFMLRALDADGKPLGNLTFTQP